MRFLAFLCLTVFLALPALARAAQNTGASITLTWSAPGDDSLTGVATRYDIRYSIQPITSQNFSLASAVSGAPPPAPPRTHQSLTVSSLAPSQLYYFAIRTVDERGNWSGISNIVQRTAPSSSVDVDGAAVAISFSSPWPNPARQSARVNLTLPTEANVVVSVFDISGRLVRTLANGMEPAGNRDLIWDLGDNFGHPVSSGMYLMRAQLADRTFVKRLIVSR